MTNYERDTIEMILGDTPKEKHDNLKSLLEIATAICYPRRGTDDEKIDIYKAADLLTNHIKNPNM